MTENDFREWAAKQGLDGDTIEQLVVLAATPEQFKAACDAMEPAPPIYPLEGIREMHEGNDFGISPAESGLMIVGSCPNGDPIALDIADDMGSVWYVGHESMHSEPLRSVSIRVADTVAHLIDGICNDGNFPFDYFEAKKKQRTE